MRLRNIIWISLSVFAISCQDGKEEFSPYQPPKGNELIHPNDVFNNENFMEPYNMAVRWRWNDRFIKPEQTATPIREDLVIPVSKLLTYFWIGVYESQGEQGKKFIKRLAPSELQYIGTYIYQEGRKLQGYAEGGTRITLLNLNKYDLKSNDWLIKSGEGVLATIHHEFSHLVHQNYGLPPGFAAISPEYKGQGWTRLSTNVDAIKLGMTSPYATLNENEDFCELIAHYLTMSESAFNQLYITPLPCNNDLCKEINSGRELIKKKLDLVLSYYKSNFGIDMSAVRDELQVRLKQLQTTNQIP